MMHLLETEYLAGFSLYIPWEKEIFIEVPGSFRSLQQFSGERLIGRSSVMWSVGWFVSVFHFVILLILRSALGTLFSGHYPS